MGYIVVEKNLRTGEVTQRGAYATDQEARLALANALEALYDANPALDFGDRDTGIARLNPFIHATPCDMKVSCRSSSMVGLVIRWRVGIGVRLRGG